MLIKSNKKQKISELVTLAKWYNKNDFVTWINHHINYCGFDSILIYNNESIFNLLDELNKLPSIIKTKVKIINVSDKTVISKITPQTYFFQKTHDTESISLYQVFIDYDEYIWINKTKYDTINNFLDVLKNNNIFIYLIPEQFISYNSYNSIPMQRENAMINECFYTIDMYQENKLLSVCSKVIAYNKIPGNFDSVHFFHSLKYNTYKNLTETINELDNYTYKINMTTTDIKYFHYHHRSLTEWNYKLNQYDMTNTTRKSYDLYKNINQELTKYPKNLYNIYINPFNI